MKCPKCGYMRGANETAPDYECPKCGVIYAKVQDVPDAVTVTPAVRKPAENVSLGQCGDCGAAVSQTAIACPKCGRLFHGARASPVVVVDVRMPFESMVLFMVKWAFASIPAAIIIAVLVFVGAAIFTAVMR